MNNETTKAIKTPLPQNVSQERLSHSQKESASHNHARRVPPLTRRSTLWSESNALNHLEAFLHGWKYFSLSGQTAQVDDFCLISSLNVIIDDVRSPEPYTVDQLRKAPRITYQQYVKLRAESTARQSPESNLAFHPIHGIYECK